MKYDIWRRSHRSSQWSKTAYFVEAVSDVQAQVKTARKFAKCGFSSMSLVAMPEGTDPNDSSKEQQE